MEFGGSDDSTKPVLGVTRKISNNSTRINMEVVDGDVEFGDEGADRVGELLAAAGTSLSRKDGDNLSFKMNMNKKKASIASTGSTASHSSKIPRFVLQPDDEDDDRSISGGPLPVATAASPTHLVFNRPGDSRR
jgi:hypothetical protein